MLRLEQLSFSYRTRPVLQDITLEIPRQSFLALIGPNGSGKTTLLRLMSKVLQPSAGKILLEDKPLSRFSARELARRMAVITSDQHFEFPFSVVAVSFKKQFPHLYRLQRLSSQDSEIVEQALEFTCVDQL